MGKLSTEIDRIMRDVSSVFSEIDSVELHSYHTNESHLIPKLGMFREIVLKGMVKGKRKYVYVTTYATYLCTKRMFKKLNFKHPKNFKIEKRYDSLLTIWV